MIFIFIVFGLGFCEEKQLLECTDLATRTMLKTLKCRQNTNVKLNNARDH